jgi:hypothetical protein
VRRSAVGRSICVTAATDRTVRSPFIAATSAPVGPRSPRASTCDSEITTSTTLSGWTCGRTRWIAGAACIGRQLSRSASYSVPACGVGRLDGGSAS